MLAPSSVDGNCRRASESGVVANSARNKLQSISKGVSKMRRLIWSLVCFAVLYVGLSAQQPAQAQERAYGQVWGQAYGPRDWERFYHYPYVFYPQNYRGNEYYRSRQSMYHRYPPEMRVPVYNKQWHNYYPSGQRYHWGHQFQLDVF